MIDDHKPRTEFNNNNNSSNNNNDNNNNNDDEHEEWKIQVVMQNSCISTRNFEETRTIYSASKPVEIFMISDTNDTIDSFLTHS